MPIQIIIAALLGLAASAALTPLVRKIARRYEFIANPTADRWHKKPTALLGGIGIVGAMVVASLLTANWTLQTGAAVLGASLLFVVGLVDDVWPIKPYQKLIAQIIAAILVISSGLILPWTPWIAINMAITVLWLVGITNAVNLLDNMDGLAAGIAAIAGCFLVANFAINGQHTEAQLTACFVGTALGFLIYNSNPASIFMGDCGSMFMGFYLAAISISSVSGGRLQSLPVLLVPVLVLLIPIFDTTLVSVMRRMSGRAISQGGRDHSSHRLVALGLSERRAVFLLYGLAIVSGTVGLGVHWLPLHMAVAAVTVFVIGMAYVGIQLGEVLVYNPDEVEAAHRAPVVSFLIDVSYKRRVFEVFLDGVLVVLSWYGAWLFIYGTEGLDAEWKSFARIAPLLVATKLTVFLLAGVYRGLWRYLSLNDAITYAKAGLISSLAFAMVLLFAYRFQGFSRAVVILDGILLFLLLTGSRVAFRLMRRSMPGGREAFEPWADRDPVLIYGAGDGGELLLREIRNNPDLKLRAVGFLDDDPLKHNKVINGIRVLGCGESADKICEGTGAKQILASTPSITGGQLDVIAASCQHIDVQIRRLRFDLELHQPERKGSRKESLVG